MEKKIIGLAIGLIAFTIIGSIVVSRDSSKMDEKAKELEATVLKVEDSFVTLQDNSHVIYTFQTNELDADIGSSILIEYTGLLNKSKEVQDCAIIHYTTSMVSKDENGIPTDWQDNGIFKDYYILAYNKLKTMSLDEKISQLLLVRYPDSNAKQILEKYQFGGYVFFEKDFRNKTEQEVVNMIKELQSVSKIPILTAVDEEGGTVVRVSSNPNLVDAPFKSSKELYTSGGFEAIKQDTITKSKVLSNLGINLNLAPVVDVSTDPSDYMYHRSLGENTDLTSTYAKTVIQASKGTGVSYTLKHFPGYGNNVDTHTGSAIDNRTYDDIVNHDLPPFKAGIASSAEAVLISHNTVTSIDSANPASLSAGVHNILRNDLNFTGIIITDDLAMGAVSSIDNVAVKAVLAGNDLIITTDYEESIHSIKNAIQNGTISESLIDKLAFRVLAWKYYKGLMFDKAK